MHTHQFFTWTTHTAETTTLLEATRLQKLYTYLCNIVTEFYLYSIVYIYLINSRLDVTHSVRHHFRTIQTLSNFTEINLDVELDFACLQSFLASSIDFVINDQKSGTFYICACSILPVQYSSSWRLIIKFL